MSPSSLYSYILLAVQRLVCEENLWYVLNGEKVEFSVVCHHYCIAAWLKYSSESGSESAYLLQTV